MPTAAKLFAAIAFMLVGFFTAEMVEEVYPRDLGHTYFSAICAGLGLLAGWGIMGPSAGEGWTRAMSSGLKTSFVLAIWGLFTFAIHSMIMQSTDRRYSGVMDALEGLAVIFFDFSQVLVTSVSAMGVLIIGGLLGGLFSAWAAVRWS